MGARLVLDLNPSGSSSPQSMISIDGMLYFTADLGSSSEEGQQTPDTDDDLSSGEEDAQETAPLSTNQIGNGLALLKSDGTTDGTKLLKEFQSINDLVEVNSELYFIADDGTGANQTGGNRLWRSDGTARGTVLVKDLFPGADPNFPQDLFEIDGVLFYSAIDGTGDDGEYPYVNGYEVWRREGEGVGSRFFRNLMPDKIITDTIISEESREVPALDENGRQIELTTTTTQTTTHNTDGTTTITTTVEEEQYINDQIETISTTNSTQELTDERSLTTEDVTEEIALSASITPQQFLNTKTTVTTEIDIANGLKTTTTVVVKDYELNGQVIPGTTTSTEVEAITPADLTTTTITEEKNIATTEEIADIAEITTNIFKEDSFPGNFTGINGNYFFTAHSSSFYSLETSAAETLIGGLELWFSDGTEAGTYPININQNNYTFYEPDDGEYNSADIVTDPAFGFATQSSSSFPRELTKFKDDLVLVANNGTSGFELWTVSDRGDNPRQIADLSEGNTSSSPEELTVVGDRLYFTANDNNGRKLWSVTNTLGTPTLVGGAGDEPKHLSNINGQLYFSAQSELGRELWVASGDSARLVADINPGSGSSSPRNLTSVNHWVDENIKTHMYFSADDGERGVELWSIDLSNNNSKPQRQADILSGPSSSEPRQIINAEERLYFTADDGRFGRELWSLGASIQGPNFGEDASFTSINLEENQKKVYQFSSKSTVSWSMNGGVDADLFKIKNDGSLMFIDAPSFEDPKDADRDNIYEAVIRATDKETGTPTDLTINIMVTNVIEGGLGDGEVGGDDNPATSSLSAILVKDIFKGNKDSNPSELIQYKGDLFFTAENKKQGNELWKSEGSKSTTSLLKDINQGKASSMPYGFTLFDNEMYFSANDGNDGVELWSSDGTSRGTKQVSDLNPGPGSSSPSDLVALDNKLIFSANDGNEGSELWGLSKETNKPSLIRDINPSIGSAPTDLTSFQQKIYFSAEGEIYGRELWETNGTKDGTKLVFDINPGGFHGNPLDLTIYNEKLYFTAETYTGGRQVWSSDGSHGGTQKISPLASQDIFSSVKGLTATREQLFFSADSKLVGNSVDSDDQELGRELWGMRGNLDSISLVLDINPGVSSSNPTALTSINNILYFSADDGIHGEELWMSDGTPEGTIRLTDINEGSKNSSPRDISEGPDGIYFSAIKDKVGRELWRLDDDSQSATRIVTADKGKKKLKALDDSNDEFRFELADQFGKAKADRITGFSPDDGDKLALSTSAFPGLSEINLVTVSSNRPLKAQQTQPSNFIYYEAEGKLYFDQNESDKGYGKEGGLFAILKGGPDLTESSFQIV